jgi:Fic family protein
VPLLKGEFKKISNNLILPDGGLHEFCPPSEVEQEVDSLLRGLISSRASDPIPAAAWLHYHLYQTHPFQTGNGRVVRAAATHVMLKAGSLPLIIAHDNRVEYRACMTAADHGDLAPLMNLFARAECNTIAQALEETTHSKVDVLHQST